MNLKYFLKFPPKTLGFSNESLITIGTLFLVVGAVEKSHAVDYLARKTFGSDGSDIWGKARMYIVCFGLSIFFNNTPLVAILLPVVKDWGRMRQLAASQLLIPLSFSVLSGSFISMIGTSTNLTVQALMQADRGYSFNFFAPAPIGAPLFVLVLIYMLIAGPFLLPNNKSGLIRAVKEKAEKLIAEIQVSKSSQFIGKPVSEMMTSLGLAPSLALKIRRKVLSAEEKEFIPPKRTIFTFFQEFFTQLKDPHYVKRISGFWPHTSLPKSTDNLRGEYELTNTEGSNQELGNDSQYADIIAPSFHEVIAADDIVFIAYAQDVVEKLMKSIAGESKGLFVLQSNSQDLPGYGTALLECIVSDSNPFLGRKVSTISREFGEKYQAGLITVRGKDWGIEDEAKNSEASPEEKEPLANDIEVVAKVIEDSAELGTNNESSEKNPNSPKDIRSISEHILGYGDIILCVTNEKQVEGLHHNKDFFVVSPVGELPIPMTFYSFFPVAIFLTMLILAATETLDICPGALMAASFFFIGGWITADDIPKMIDIRLLMLIGCSLSFAKGMTKSGLAEAIAQSINDSNPSNFGALLLTYAITLVITELISNNAAAALMYPIASALSNELGVSFKPFVMAVLVASTAGFMSPIGYQTHVMVWGPGGYNFWDFMIFGFIPDILYWIIGCFIIVGVYPF